ncbi:hypothetical protein LINPERHAP2_LOCUS3844, partial [Linum perenne]
VLQRTTTGDGFEKVDDSAGRGAKPILRFRAHDNGGACWRTRRVLPVPVAKPGQEIKDGLQTIEGEADILTCIGEDGLNGKHHLLKVFVKKLTRFQAWKRMVDIQKQLCGVVPAIGDGFRLEEIGDDGTPIREAEGGSGLSVILNPLLLGCTATPEVAVDQPAPDEPDHNPYHEASNEPPKVGEAAIEDMNPPVQGPASPSLLRF